MLAHSLHFPASPPASDRHLVPAFVLDQAVFVQSCWGRSYIVILNSCEYDTLPLDQAVSVHPLILSAKLPRVSLPRTASEDSAGKALTKTTGKRLKNRRALIWNWIAVHFCCLCWFCFFIGHLCFHPFSFRKFIIFKSPLSQLLDRELNNTDREQDNTWYAQLWKKPQASRLFFRLKHF